MIRTNLNKLNSATKYPSILTYHEIDGNSGCLKDNVQISFNEQDEVIQTEKIDGANARIILFSDQGYFIGSREDLLTASGDLVPNPSLGIVETLQPLVEAFKKDLDWRAPVVLFGEVYGNKKIGKSGKNYTNSGQSGFRLFDGITFESDYDFEKFLNDTPIEKISSWREHGGQKFLEEKKLQGIAELIGVSLTPRIKGTRPPQGVPETLEWLKGILPGKTNAAIDGDGGKPEGIVIRTSDRVKIAKIRFEDYERTLRIKNESRINPRT